MRNVIERIAEQFGVHSESGVTAIEYGLIAALIAVAIVARHALALDLNGLSGAAG